MFGYFVFVIQPFTSDYKSLMLILLNCSTVTTNKAHYLCQSIRIVNDKTAPLIYVT